MEEYWNRILVVGVITPLCLKFSTHHLVSPKECPQLQDEL